MITPIDIVTDAPAEVVLKAIKAIRPGQNPPSQVVKAIRDAANNALTGCSVTVILWPFYYCQTNDLIDQPTFPEWLDSVNEALSCLS